MPACKRCNGSTGPSEQIVAALVRAMRERTPRGLDEDVTNKIFREGLAVNAPEILREWATPLTARQTRRLKAMREQYGQVRPINIAPLTRAHIRAFAAKLGCALHYNQTGAILPSSGGVLVWMQSLEQAARKGRLDPCFTALLGPPTPLRQGKAEVADQFVWRSAHDDDVGSIHLVTLPGFMEIALAAATDVSIFPEVDRAGGVSTGPVRGS